MIAKRITALFGILMLAAVSVAAQASKLEGTWEGKMNHEGTIETITFELHAKGDALAGKVFRNGVEFGSISDSKVQGNRIAFKVDVVSFDGSLEGTEMKLTVTVYNGNKFSVDATRKQASS